MNIKHSMRAGLVGLLGLGAISLSIASCGGDDDEMDGQPSDGGGDAAMCDPMGPNPAMGALLNAPLAEDVEVIVKTPAHPGAPGPSGLP